MLAGEPHFEALYPTPFSDCPSTGPHSPLFPSDTPAPTHLQHQSFPLSFFLLLGSSPGPLPLPLGPPNQELGEHQGHEEPGPVHLAGVGGHSLVGGLLGQASEQGKVPRWVPMPNVSPLNPPQAPACPSVRLWSVSGLSLVCLQTVSELPVPPSLFGLFPGPASVAGNLQRSKAGIPPWGARYSLLFPLSRAQVSPFGAKKAPRVRNRRKGTPIPRQPGTSG